MYLDHYHHCYSPHIEEKKFAIFKGCFQNNKNCYILNASHHQIPTLFVREVGIHIKRGGGCLKYGFQTQYEEN